MKMRIDEKKSECECEKKKREMRVWSFVCYLSIYLIFLLFILSSIRHRPWRAEHRHAAALRAPKPPPFMAPLYTTSTAAAWRCSARLSLIFQQELDSRRDENPKGFRPRQGHAAPRRSA
jgi:hypothetical protein